MTTTLKTWPPTEDDLKMKREICWHDSVGDRWEREGTDPGRIFEFHSVTLGPDALPGGMLETMGSVSPGDPPGGPQEVKRLLVRLQSGEEIEMPGMRAIAVAYFQRIVADLC